MTRLAVGLFFALLGAPLGAEAQHRCRGLIGWGQR